MAQIIITVDKDGQFTIEAQGYQGTSCEQATAGLEAALGTVDKRDYKAEYHEITQQHNTTHIHQ